MAYLKNSNNKIVIDAVLTRYGKEKLSSTGDLGITKFAAYDDDIDYNLYTLNYNNSQMSTDLINQSIINLPTLEAFNTDLTIFKNPLFGSDNITGINSVTKMNFSPNIYISQGLGYDPTFEYLGFENTFTPTFLNAGNYNSRQVFFKMSLFRISENYYNEEIEIIPDPSSGEYTNEIRTIVDRINSKGHQNAYKASSRMIAGQEFVIILRHYPPAGIVQQYKLVFECNDTVPVSSKSFVFNVYGRGTVLATRNQSGNFGGSEAPVANVTPTSAINPTINV